jgi:hypothetical protein
VEISEGYDEERYHRSSLRSNLGVADDGIFWMLLHRNRSFITHWDPSCTGKHWVSVNVQTGSVRTTAVTLLSECDS